MIQMTTPERITALEVRQAAIETKLGKVDEKLEEIRDVLLQAKGVRWVLVTTISLVGAALLIMRYLTGK